MCQTLQQCTIFHFGYSKIFVPLISSGSNLHQFFTAFSLRSKTIHLFTPNLTLISGAHFQLKQNNIFPPIQFVRMIHFDQSKYDKNFLYFCINFILYFRSFFAAPYVIIATHCHFDVVNLYIYHHVLVFLHSRAQRFMKKADKNVQSKTAFFKATHFLKEWK